jgi:hypothetical protein
VIFNAIHLFFNENIRKVTRIFDIKRKKSFIFVMIILPGGLELVRILLVGLQAKSEQAIN